MSKTIGISMSLEDHKILEELKEVWGFSSMSAFLRSAAIALPGRVMLETKEDSGLISPLESRALNIMRGGRR